MAGEEWREGWALCERYWTEEEVASLEGCSGEGVGEVFVDGDVWKQERTVRECIITFSNAECFLKKYFQ